MGNDIGWCISTKGDEVRNGNEGSSNASLLYGGEYKSEFKSFQCDKKEVDKREFDFLACLLYIDNTDT